MAVITAVALCCSGCIVKSAGTASSSTPIPHDKTYTYIGLATGTSTGLVLLGLIPFASSDPVGAARDAALNTIGADAMIDCTIEYRYSDFFAFMIIHTVVTGKGITFNY